MTNLTTCTPLPKKTKEWLENSFRKWMEEIIKSKKIKKGKKK